MSRSNELKVLTDSLEEILTMQFPTHDAWNTGLTEWKKERSRSIDCLIESIKALLGYGE